MANRLPVNCCLFFLSLFFLLFVGCFFGCYSLQDVQFGKTYDKEPTVIIAANHNSEENNLKPKYISVTAWIEVFLFTVFS